MSFRWLWNDIRPNLVWHIILWLMGGVFTALIAMVWAHLNRPITGVHAVGIFLAFCLASSFLAILSKRRTGGMDILLVGLPILMGLVFLVWAYSVGKKVADMAGTIKLMEARITRYVLPRTLTAAQKESIRTYLARFTPHPVEMSVIRNNEEASSFREELKEAVEKGGWPVTNIDAGENIPEGLSISFTTPPESHPLDRLKLPKKPEDIIQEALTQAGVIINSLSSTEGDPHITTATLTITIGSRRRDKWAIPYRNHFHEGTLPEDPDQ